MSKLERKVALVTGASKGIGAGIANALASAGAAVVVNYASDRPGAEAVVNAIILRLLQFFRLGPCLASPSLWGSRLHESAISPIRAVWSNRLSPVLGATQGESATRRVRTGY
jgi:NAD(P)-dependent dehydrogenase (short-subunit alcohol dehydrogenase family)